MSDGIRLTEEQQKARDLRSLAIGLGLFTFVALVFIVTVVRKMQEISVVG